MTRMPKEFEFKFEGCYIAGGAILSLATKNDIADYDVYPKNLQGLTNAVYELMNDFSSQIANISDRAITFKVNESKNRNGERNIVQIMTFDWFPTAESIFDFFDYTVCMGAFDCDSKQYLSVCVFSNTTPPPLPTHLCRCSYCCSNLPHTH